MHFNFQNTVALTGFAAPAPDIERKPSAGVAAHFGVRCLGKQLPNVGKNAGIGRGIGTRRPADGRLVNIDYFIQLPDSVDPPAPSGFLLGAVQFCRQRLVEHLVDKGGFS